MFNSFTPKSNKESPRVVVPKPIQFNKEAGKSPLNLSSFKLSFNSFRLSSRFFSRKERTHQKRQSMPISIFPKPTKKKVLDTGFYTSSLKLKPIPEEKELCVPNIPLDTGESQTANERKEISFLNDSLQISCSDPHIRLFEFINQNTAGKDRIREGDKVYACKYCGDEFSNGCALGGHISKMHKGLSFLSRRWKQKPTTKFTEKDRARYFRKHIKKKRQV